MVEDFSTQFNVLYLHTRVKAGSVWHPVYVFICILMKKFLSETYLMYEILHYYTNRLYIIVFMLRILNNHILRSVPFDHDPIDYSHSQ